MSSPDPRLFIWPRGADVSAVKAIVEELVPTLGYKIKPFWYEPGLSEDVERVLVLREGFEHGPIVDYIYPKSPALMREAVEWALQVRADSRGARDSFALMQSIFGEDLTYTIETERDEEMNSAYV